MNIANLYFSSKLGEITKKEKNALSPQQIKQKIPAKIALFYVFLFN